MALIKEISKHISQRLPSLLHSSLGDTCQNQYSKVTVRTFAQRSWKSSNAGIDRRLKFLKKNDVPIDNKDVENMDLDDLESDFMAVGEMYDEHLRDLKNHRDKNQMHIVRHKYFKPELSPNLLTWSEKEQIRYLYDSDSVEWPVEKLAASFPASENTIKKIIKAQWRPDDSSDILRHDKLVHKNWQLFLEGKIEVETRLKEHLLQFSQRSAMVSYVPTNNNEKQVCETYKTGSTKSSEFLNIVKAYRDAVADISTPRTLTTPAEACQQITENINCSQVAPKEDTYIIDGSKPKKSDKHLTLNQYRETCNTSSEGKHIQHKTLIKDTSSFKMQHFSSKGRVVKNKSSELVTQSARIESYPEKITIPKQKWIEGGTYRVGDCFYDDDGEFLYRVPGMS